MADQVREVGSGTGAVVVHGDDLEARLDQPLAQVRAQEVRAAGDDGACGLTSGATRSITA
jgi:hypothetical protein